MNSIDTDIIKSLLGVIVSLSSVWLGSYLISEYWWTWKGVPSAVTCIVGMIAGFMVAVHYGTEPKLTKG